jgi:hypothetical protein
MNTATCSTKIPVISCVSVALIYRSNQNLRFILQFLTAEANINYAQRCSTFFSPIPGRHTTDQEKPAAVGMCGTLFCAFALISEIYNLIAHLFITAEQTACGIAVGLWTLAEHKSFCLAREVVCAVHSTCLWLKKYVMHDLFAHTST